MHSSESSIYSPDGKILLYSLSDFYSNIVNGDDCFICGAKAGSKKFNDEHVLPDWLLKKYSLHNKEITLSNSATFNYSRYRIPCCQDCNSELARVYENPISELLKLSYSEICDKINSNRRHLDLLFSWLMLIFFKCHLKDRDFKWHLDTRKGAYKISDTYEWSDMHHIHCLIRKHYTKAILNKKILGSIYILPAIALPGIESFDFINNKLAKSIMMRLNEFSIVCVFDDSCAANTLFSSYMAKINRQVTPFQLIDIFCHYTYLNIHLKNRPIFYSEFNKMGKYYIKAKLPKTLELVDKELELITHGELLYHYCKDRIAKVRNRDRILNQIKNGKRNYLFDKKGKFVDHSKDL